MRVERIIQDAERCGRILGVRLPPQEDGEGEPWTAPPSGRRVLALERPISAKPVDIDAYEAAAYPLYRSAKSEAVRA